MEKYLQIIINSYTGYADYLWKAISQPSWNNYFYWLIGVSLVCFGLEYFFPWRKNQSKIRNDFWMDAFYMFFNFFLFGLMGFSAVSNVFAQFFNDLLASIGITNWAIFTEKNLPYWIHFLILFIFKDFIQFNIHRLLHAVPWLWEFHKVHHSVKEMGFAAHLRYHWMENVVYKVLQYIPLGIIGYGLRDFFAAEIIALCIGHLNHSNFDLPIGKLKYIFNSPQMHLWHHAKYIPSPIGINFGISLSIWDYLFKTAYFPEEDANLELGFEDENEFPKDFVGQELYPLGKKTEKQ